ncbi:MAG: nucleotide-binding protein [Microcoleaceae cyanobacterium]
MLSYSLPQSTEADQVNQVFTDSFCDQTAAGKTIGTYSSSGVCRKGIDVEKRIKIDNGALRFQPLLKPGWGRQGIAYGPYKRTNGLAFAVFLGNGHNTSQAERIEPLKRRLKEWLEGNHTLTPKQQLLSWIKSPQKRYSFHQFLRWVYRSPEFAKHFPLPKLDENLAVGWFPNEVPNNPGEEGNGFIVHATGPENGELWTRVGEALLPTIRGLQNLQVYYVVVLRERGAAYYAASVPNANGLVDYPNMRPLAIDPFSADPEVYAALYQSVLGQIGFRVDTRVYGAQVTQVPSFATWYGSAQLADKLTGRGTLNETSAEVGGYWQVHQGRFERTFLGTTATASSSIATLSGSEAAGLIHLLVQPGSQSSGVQLLWRVQDKQNYWCFEVDDSRVQLRIQTAGKWETLGYSELWQLKPNCTNSLQILDDGETFNISLNGKLVFSKGFRDARLHHATGAGIGATQADTSVHFQQFEVHPRSLPIPFELDMGSPWMATGSEIAIADNFSGNPQNLAGKTPPVGDGVWRKLMGEGDFRLTGHDAVQVVATVKHPNPGRTAYTVPWDQPKLADVQVTITPPGTGARQRQRGRGGLIFWQDPENYLIINNWLDDFYTGASISCFFCLNGFEELYDAVWTNVGSRVFWGVPHTLRVVFDGMHFMTYIDTEPVVYRALTDVYPDAKRLRIHHVGIVANWEWGNDTGSIFHNFVAKV